MLFVIASGDNPENDAARIMKLLKDGAHAFADGPDAGGGGDAAGGEEKGMAQENIDQVSRCTHSTLNLQRLRPLQHT